MTVGIDGVNPVSPNNPPLKAVHPDDRAAFQPAQVDEAPEPEITEPEVPQTEPEVPQGTPQDGTVVAEGEAEPVPAAPVSVDDLPVNPDIEVIVPAPGGDQ